jgi:hypothetical protein
VTTPFDETLASFRLGQSETLLRLDGPDQFHQATTLLLTQAVRQVHIVTPNLEAERFNNTAFADALSHFARRSQYTETRILVGDPAIAIRWGHHVVNLGRRLSSLIHIRRLHEDDYDPAEAWIVVDDIGLIRRDTMDGYLGMLSAKAIPQAQQKNRRFAELWERGHEVAEFREMFI